jgi:2-keto-3-deoxy-L-rhamnonate aldolase RhmA
MEKRPDPNRLGAKLRSALIPGNPALGGIVMEHLRPSLVKLYRSAGFDFLYLETEHALPEPTRLSDFVLVARDNGLPIVAKTPELGRAWICFLLEAGVSAIQLPRTESRAQVEQLLEWMRFPPHGTRAGAPCYGNVDYVPPDDHRAWLDGADAATLAVAHIETELGVANCAEIASTPGLGMVYVGPYDLSIAAGHPGDSEHRAVKERMLSVLEACRANDVPFGTTPSGPDAAGYWASRGASFFEACDELTFILRGAAELVESWSKAARPG